jgi:hypothetical protein
MTSLISMETQVQNLVKLGLDVRKVWNTVHFYQPGGAVSLAFRHRDYGFNKRNAEPSFLSHVQKDPALWFRGSSACEEGPSKRVRKKEKALLESALTAGASGMLTHPSLVMAHDIFNTKRDEGGPKDFALISPWQFLNTLNESNNTKTEISINIFKRGDIKTPTSNGWERSWESDGQPLSPWPRCSLYNSRCDPDETDENQHYVFTIDIDGKHCMTSEERENKDGSRTMRDFETDSTASPARLRTIGSVVREAFRGLGFTVHVSWHKSIGWKPSWRGYAVGAIFRRPEDAKAFMNTSVIPKLKEDYSSWCEDESEWCKLLDDTAYRKGVDRCIGSAKLVSKTPRDMRFLNTSPLDYVSDAHLTEMFHRCPNEYVLMCLGWIYAPEYLTATPSLIFVPGATPERSFKRHRSSSSIQSEMKTGTRGAVETERAVSVSLREANLTEKWTGVNAVKFCEDWVEMRPSGDSLFCVFKNCEKQSGWTPSLLNDDGKSHTARNDKMVFRVKFSPEAKDPERRYWLTQRCYGCESSEKNPFRKVCPVEEKHVKILQNIFKPETSRKEAKLESAILMNYCIDFEFAK